MHLDLEARFAELERQQSSMKRKLNAHKALIILLVSISAISSAVATVAVKTNRFDHIVAKDITVIDSNGVVRARMTSDAPDAVMAGGHVSKRGTKAAGFIVYDEEGIERGGYVTMDEGSNAMLSLDSKYHMQANMIAGPDEVGVSVLNLRGGNQQVETRVDSDGARTSVSKSGLVLMQSPELKLLNAETCTRYRKLEAQYPGKNVCRARFTEEACKACLE